MDEHIIISLCLLGLVILDATGDALRLRMRQIMHHMLESLHLVLFFVIWALFGFKWEYVLIYIMGRIVVFDVIFNLVAGLPVLYVGEGSVYDIAIRKVASVFPVHPSNPSFIFKFMALLVWISLVFL